MAMLVGFVAPSRANVIYDVAVFYLSDPFLGEVTFAMEFADDTGTKGTADLIGGDVQGLLLFVDNDHYPLIAGTQTVTQLSFTPQTDIFTFQIQGVYGDEPFPNTTHICDTLSNVAILCVNEPIVIRFHSMNVTLRQTDGTAPVPGTLWLLTLGLLAMWLGNALANRRRYWTDHFA